MEYIKTLTDKKIDFNILGKFKKKTKTKILLIAWNVHPGKDFAQLLNEMDDFEVTWIGTNAPDIDFVNFPTKQYIITTEFGTFPLAVRKFSLKSILDILGYDFDLILHIQDWTVFTDTEKSQIPYIYIHSEAFYPIIPLCAWRVLSFTRYSEANLQHRYGSKFKYGYLPFALRNDLVNTGRGLNEYKRKINCSFAGEIYHLNQLYEERQRIVQFLRFKLKKQFRAHILGPYDQNDFKIKRKIYAGKGRLNGVNYIKLLLQSKIGFNVPTGNACNFRDFEVPGLGALLLTRKTQDLIELGFEDQVNCRFYKDEYDAYELIKDGYCYDEKVAFDGYIHVLTNHTYFQRILDLREIMKEYCSWIED